MPGFQFSDPVPPLYDVLLAFKGDIMAELRVCLPATIRAFDRAAGTVDVSVDWLQTVPNGLPIEYPLLYGLPVITLQGGGTAVAFPIAAGDKCLVIIADRCLSAWRKTGTPQVLPTLRKHDLSDGFALVGVAGAQAPFTLLTDLLLTASEAGISSKVAKVAIDSGTGKVTIQNTTKNLATVLTGLISDVNTMVGHAGILAGIVGTMTTASIAAGTPQTAANAVVVQLAADAAAIAARSTELAALLY